MTNAAALASAGGIALWAWPLIALRLTLMLLALVVLTPAYYVLAPFFPRNPVPRRFLGLIGWIAGARVHVRGERTARNVFYLANHVSWIDILALAGKTGCAFVAHDGLAQIGPLRWLCQLNDTVFIARHSRASVARQIEQVRTALVDTGALAIFPEGTCGDGSALLPFKSSLLSALEGETAHIPVQPVWIDYGPQVHKIAWTDEPGLSNALRMLARLRPIDLTLHFLPPLNAEARADRKRMAHAARAAIEAAKRS
ncbi:1-acyl-sn-glycerol-3-phosphate acyltransferase [Novosphingobium sp. Rr 2-17]|uniref:lysophospholipid acyltransferase family protein n=1 Tax=Novosphingobium sp. Rr 2-17 TaxID=555793 RepID=UPI0002698BCD|nr:lysophospholipid acyltransferase family protein [Novosphingobium sp. Rr 2-17]EIZ78635.1 1-acyl-sn-glycerol-3-phosphate acyltransferase [Novosphingobium sp. Rr 2-17]